MVCGPHHTAAPLSRMRSAANKYRLRDHVRLPLPLEYNRPSSVSPHWSSTPRAQVVRGVEFESSTYVCALRLRHWSGSGRAFGDEYSQPRLPSVWLRICSISIVRRFHWSSCVRLYERISVGTGATLSLPKTPLNAVERTKYVKTGRDGM
jgi:hypothetical protein